MLRLMPTVGGSGDNVQVEVNIASHDRTRV